MKEQYKQAVQTFLNKILKKDSNKDVFNAINSNIVLIREKYSDSCINNLIEITNIIVRLKQEDNVDYPKCNLSSDEIIKKALNYYKDFNKDEYDRLIIYGKKISNLGIRKLIRNDKTINVIPAVIHQFRHLIENDNKNDNYNVLSNALAIFNEINYIDELSDNNNYYNILKLKRINSLEETSLFINTYLKMISESTIINKESIIKYFGFYIKESNDYEKILNKIYTLRTFESDVKNIVSTLKAIDLSISYKDVGPGEIKLELDSIIKTFRSEELTVMNNKALNGFGAGLPDILENMDNYETYVYNARINTNLNKVN